MTVLVVTHSRDDHAPAVLAELTARGVRAVRFDTDIHRERSPAELTAGAEGTQIRLWTGDGVLDGEEVDAILYRHLHLSEAADIDDPLARELAESELRATLEGALLAIDAYWLNHPHANRLARNKPMQLALAAGLGLTVPDTLISDDPLAIRERYRAWDGQMIAKLVGGQLLVGSDEQQYVVYTTAVEPDDLRSDDALAACPAIYQRRIEKAFDVRVTIVGDSMFACRIDSQGRPAGEVDWRAEGADVLPIRSIELDGDVAERCRALMRALRLDLAGIDLIVTAQGETIFLELNAAGQWLWAQEATGVPIAAAVADQLIRGAQARGAASPA